MTQNFFVGANSGAGFQNLFPEVMDLEDTYDLLVLKGGPGVGKNTFMRQVGAAFEAVGETVEYLWCSGDPDSLDGVVLPSIRSAIVDGTAPHVMEPAYPAAVDRYVNLGQFYDVAAIKAHREAVETHTRAYKAAYQRAYRALRAARAVEVEAVGNADLTKPQKRLEAILRHEVPDRKAKPGRVRRRFLGSITHKGWVWRFESVDALCPRVIAVRDPLGQGGPLFEMLCREVGQRGWDAIHCLSPEDMGQVEHLLIPDLGLAFVTSRPTMTYPGKAAREVRLDTPKGGKLLRRMADTLREEGVRELQAAKASHDALEAVYNPYVDFEGVQTLAALETGRLLGYRG